MARECERGGNVMHVERLPVSRIVGTGTTVEEIVGCLEVALDETDGYIRAYEVVEGMEHSGRILYPSNGHGTPFTKLMSCTEVAQQLMALISDARYEPLAGKARGKRKGWEIRHSSGKVPMIIVFATWL